MTDDGVRERHGMRSWESICGETNITVWEAEDALWINGHSAARRMTPAQARYLARKLYRLARRIDTRNEEQD